MNKIILLLLMLPIAIFTFAWKPHKKAVPVPKVLQLYPFDMAESEYKKYKSKYKTSNINDCRCSGFDTKLLGHDAKLQFSRRNYDSYRNMRKYVIPLKKEKYTRTYIQQFNKIKNLLVKKYGTPTQNKSKYTSSFYQKEYRKKLGGKELAFTKGAYKYFYAWTFEKFIIELSNKYNGKQIIIELSYIEVPKKEKTSKFKNNDIDEL